MAKTGGRGHKCPNCDKLTHHDKGSYRECSRCGCVGWGWHQQVAGVGKGRGNQCPNCEKLTLHKILVKQGISIRRCGTCDYSLVEFLTDDQ